MGLVLRLVETRPGSGTRSVDVREFSRPGNLRDIANLGLTLAKAKQRLARVQRAVVAVQARDHAALRPDCASCGGRCQVKDWRSRQVATLFGKVAVRLPRFHCPRSAVHNGALGSGFGHLFEPAFSQTHPSWARVA